MTLANSVGLELAIFINWFLTNTSNPSYSLFCASILCEESTGISPGSWNLGGLGFGWLGWRGWLYLACLWTPLRKNMSSTWIISMILIVDKSLLWIGARDLKYLSDFLNSAPLRYVMFSFVWLVKLPQETDVPYWIFLMTLLNFYFLWNG